MATQTIPRRGFAHTCQVRLAAWCAALNVDFCPWANRWVYWMKNPLWCLVAALAVSTTCGLLVNPQVWIISGALALVLALGIGWPWLVIRGVTCELQFERLRGRVGQPVAVRLKLTNRWPWPVWGIVLVRGFETGNGGSAGVALARLPGWWRGEYEWMFVPPRRGVFPLESPVIATGYPFGIRSVSRPVSVLNQLIVWPRTAFMAGLPDASESRPGALRLTDRRAGDLGERLGTRCFQQGDALRRVHWGQTARQGRLIVCELQAPAIAAVQVEIEMDADVHHVGDLPSTTLEPAIEAGASICESLVRQHAIVQCTFADQQFRLTDANGVRRLMDALAHVPATGARGADTRPCPRSLDSDASLRIVVTTERGRARSDGEFAGQQGRRFVIVRPSVERPGSGPGGRGLGESERGAGGDTLDSIRNEWRRICRDE